MSTKNLTLIVIIGAILLLGGCGCGSYNSMNGLKQQANEAWSNVENQYKRRSDLIGNLVNTVKGYADFEKSTLTDVINARAKATSVTIDASKMDASQLQQFQQAQDGLSSTLSRLMVVIEKYPDLKANQNFIELQAQLEGTENRITVERKKFNEVTQTYNTYILKFPNNIVAGMCSFQAKPYFAAKTGAAIIPTFLMLLMFQQLQDTLREYFKILLPLPLQPPVQDL